MEKDKRGYRGEQSVLELVGGFDSYQKRIYQEIIKRVKNWTMAQVVKFDELLEDHYKIDGLERGLVGLIETKRPLSSRNIEVLEDPLDFSVIGLFFDELEPYLKYQEPKGQLPGLVEEENRRGLNCKSAEYADLIYEIELKSDEIIQQRKAA